LKKGDVIDGVGGAAAAAAVAAAAAAAAAQQQATTASSARQREATALDVAVRSVKLQQCSVAF